MSGDLHRAMHIAVDKLKGSGGSDSRYVSSCEANWCPFFFEMHDHEPSVLCLGVHLPDHQSVVINPNRDINAQQALYKEMKIETLLLLDGLRPICFTQMG